ncbi:hypothetical protein EYF80_057934 [Liparis tanakae]|uniref:Uncharacterized protein n=1 Tax=Liparis tanakae TaxID=230148 RepID=A0A4Z2ESS9_9TELE|nr:hypothetical protein EYF80_057934 [Liparis tanakae]
MEEEDEEEEEEEEENRTPKFTPTSRSVKSLSARRRRPRGAVSGGLFAASGAALTTRREA